MFGYQKGFTFTELLLVLSVVTILTYAILPLGDRWIRQQSNDDAMKALTACIYNAQAYSMAHNVSTKLVFKETTSSYEFLESLNVVCSGAFPEGMFLSSRSRLNEVEFTSNGNIYKSGVITLNTSTGIKELRLQLVKGRVIVYD